MSNSIVFYCLGVLARLSLAYLIELSNNKSLKFDWRYALGQLATSLSILVAIVSTNLDLITIQATPLVAFLSGWGAGDAGSRIQKVGRYIKKK